MLLAATVGAVMSPPPHAASVHAAAIAAPVLVKWRCMDAPVGFF
jgi:hypothetical protein